MCEWLVAESCGLLWIKDAAFLSNEQVRSLCRHCMNYCAQEDVNVISTISSPFTIQVLGLEAQEVDLGQTLTTSVLIMDFPVLTWDLPQDSALTLSHRCRI